MENFDEAIAPYANKIVNPDNASIIKYQIVTNRRAKTLNIREVQQMSQEKQCPPNGQKGKVRGTYPRIITPLGIFGTVEEAAKATGFSKTTISYRCERWTTGENFFYEKT